MKALVSVLVVAVVSAPVYCQKSKKPPMTIVGAEKPAVAKPAATPAPAAQPASPASVAPIPTSPQSLTNASIVQMKNAGMSDELIISTIHTQPGTYAVTLNDLLGLKKAGVSDPVIVAMQQETAAVANSPVPAQPEPAVHDASSRKPRVFVFSASHGNTWWSVRDQTIELTKDFTRDCPMVQMTINRDAADYTVALNHIEVGALVRNNQIEIADRGGDVVGRTSDGGSMAKGAKKACEEINANWNSRAPAASPPPRAGGH